MIDRKKSFLNVTVAIFFRMIILVSTIFVRRLLIRYVGNEANGLNSLYLNLFGFLTVAELGVGEAITFCMYKPIVEGDTQRVAALFQLFRKSYFIIGGVILGLSLLMMPVLPRLAKDYVDLSINLYLTFFLMMVSIVISYVFSAKTSLMNAYKNNYITTTITSCGMIVQQVLQIMVLLTTASFVWYLVCRIVAILLQWVATEVVTRARHADILSQKKQKLDPEMKVNIVKNIKALFMHRIGSVLVNATDSVIISAFVGVVILGKYSNYTAIVVSMIGVISLFFSPLTSIIGHLFVEDKQKAEKYYSFFYTLNVILGFVFFLGFYAVIDNLIVILFGDNLELSRSISFVITVNYFVQFMRKAITLFRNATGTFYYDRWKSLLEGGLNVVLSVGFVLAFSKVFGDDFAIVGVILATIITNLTICHIVEPYVLYKYAFGSSVKRHLIVNYSYIALFIAMLAALEVSMISSPNPWVELFANGAISLAFSFAFSLFVYLSDKNFRTYFQTYILEGIVRKLKK